MAYLVDFVSERHKNQCEDHQSGHGEDESVHAERSQVVKVIHAPHYRKNQERTRKVLDADSRRRRHFFAARSLCVITFVFSTDIGL